jgi:3-methyl-2-oxobutanoate hydroxymethyltransferase
MGLTFGRQPRFVRQYANVKQVMTDAINAWSADVKSGEYPSDQESYGLTEDTMKELGQLRSTSAKG